ncbi:hypothetical protein AADZ84_17650, partial [Colwelliaceae bacterium MEBiC 14330]
MTQVAITGTVSNVEDNQTVTLTVTDGTTALTFDTLVTAGVWTVSNADLSSLHDGQLTYTAQVSDIAGNPASASTNTDKDSQASITVEIDSGNDNFLLIDEITPVIINGSVTDIEPGQTVTVVLSNDSGDTSTIT